MNPSSLVCSDVELKHSSFVVSKTRKVTKEKEKEKDRLDRREWYGDKQKNVNRGLREGAG